MSKSLVDRGRLLILSGWAALAVGIVIPLAVSVLAWSQTREMRCGANFEQSFAPLLVTCGQRDPATLVFGWVLWGLTMSGLIVAVVAAVTAVIASVLRGWSPFMVFESCVLLVAVHLVALVAVAVLSVDQTLLGGTNAWMLYVFGGSFLVVVGVAVTHPITWLVIKSVVDQSRRPMQKERPWRSSPHR